MGEAIKTRHAGFDSSTAVAHVPSRNAHAAPDSACSIFADVHQPEIWFTCDQPGCSAAFDNYRELEAHLKERYANIYGLARTNPWAMAQC